MSDQNASDQKVAQEAGRSKLDVKALPVREYLDQTVVQVLLRGMSSLVKERPDDPIIYLAQFLLKHHPDPETRRINITK